MSASQLWPVPVLDHTPGLLPFGCSIKCKMYKVELILNQYNNALTTHDSLSLVRERLEGGERPTQWPDNIDIKTMCTHFTPGRRMFSTHIHILLLVHLFSNTILLCCLYYTQKLFTTTFQWVLWLSFWNPIFCECELVKCSQTNVGKQN